MSHDADGHEFLAVVAAVHHQRVGEALNDGTLCLAESLDCVSTCGMRYIDWLADLYVVAASQLLVSITVSNYVPHMLPLPSVICTRRGFHVRERNVSYLDILVAPFVEELCAADLVRNLLGKDRICLWRLNFYFAVRHSRCVSGVLGGVDVLE